MALGIHASTLVALDIETEPWAECEKDESGKSSGFRINLRELVNLKYLKMPVALYVHEPCFQDPSSWDWHDGATRFPPSIEELTLTFEPSEESGDIRALEYYIGPSVLPNLKVLHIHCHSPKTIYLSLDRFTKDQGIKLRLYPMDQLRQNHELATQFAKSCKGWRQRDKTYGRTPTGRTKAGGRLPF